MFKKHIALLMSVMMLLSFTACGGNEAPADDPSAATVNRTTTTAAGDTTVTTDTTIETTAVPTATTAQTTVETVTETTATPTTEATTASTTTLTTVPTIAPTTSPTVSYTVPASAAVDRSYFSDVVFVGDSVSLKLTNYHLSNFCFAADTVFLTSGSLGVANAMWDLNRPDAVHPLYQGEKVTVVDGIRRSGKTKVYLMLGTNDLGLYGVEGTINNLKTLTAQIKEASPDVQFYMQSVTPLVDDYYSLTNEKVRQYNALLSELCRENGWYYLDVASVMRDDNGCLIRSYCSDPDGMGIHFTNEGCRVWTDYLYTHTTDQ